MIWFGKSFIEFCESFINLIKLVSTRTCSSARVRLEVEVEVLAALSLPHRALPSSPLFHLQWLSTRRLPLHPLFFPLLFLDWILQLGWLRAQRVPVMVQPRLASAAAVLLRALQQAMPNTRCRTLRRSLTPAATTLLTLLSMSPCRIDSTKFWHAKAFPILHNHCQKLPVKPDADGVSRCR